MPRAVRGHIRPQHFGERTPSDRLAALDREKQEQREAHLRVMLDAHGPDVHCALAQRSEADERGHGTAVC